MPSPDDLPRDDAFSGLAASSIHLHPDDIPAAAATAARRLGLDDLRIYLIDLEQRVLRRFTADAVAVDGADEEVSVEGTLAGRAYRSERPLAGESHAGRTAVWLPLLDSAERLGALTATTTRVVDDELLGRFSNFASLVGELISNKSAYGDSITRRRRTRPLSLAAELRWAMLPPLTYSGRNVTISGVLEPAYDIAGDTFDYAVNGDTAHLAIIDAIGHGLEAARIANLAVAAYRHGRRLGYEPAGIYAAMDTAVADQFGTEKFATAQLATLALSTGRLRWVNAGHPPPMVLRRHRRIDLTSEPCLPVGLALDEAPVVNESELEPGDLVLFFTDGIIEARSAEGEQFGRDRLGDLLARAAAAEQTPAETVRRLAHAVLDHQEGVLEDDGTLVLLVWHGPPAPFPFPNDLTPT